MKLFKSAAVKLGIKKVEKQLLKEARKAAKQVSKMTKSLKSFLKKKSLPTRGKIRFIPREADVKNGKILWKDGGYVDKFGNVWKIDKSKNYVEWDVQLSEQDKK